MKKIYPFGYNKAAVNIMQLRTATRNANLFLQYTKPGMRILDVGCGPGTITTSLASKIDNSDVIGIDIEPSQLDIAREHAKEQNVHNCHFETASIVDLPFENNDFDAVFGHTILMQLDDPKPALEEIKRVLKPGGIVSFREVDFSSNVFGPDDSAMKELMHIFRKSFLYNGSNPDIGRDLPTLLSEVNFEVKEFNLSYSQACKREDIIELYNAMCALWEQADFPIQAVDLGWISQEENKAMPERLKQEALLPHTINGVCYVEVVAVKPSQ